MNTKSSAQKVIKVDKRLLEDTGKSTFFTSTMYGFWSLMTIIALLAMAVTYLTTDFENRVANNENPLIDPITTASTSSSKRPITIDQRQKQRAANHEQKRKTDDILRIVQRLRGEQASINNRIAQLKQDLRQTRQLAAGLEKKVQKSLAPSSEVATAPLQVAKPPQAPNLNPEQNIKDQTTRKVTRTIERSPKSVQLKKTTNLAKPVKTKIIKALSDSAKQEAKKTDKGITTKQKTAQKQDIDETVVGSINLAESTKFAIDLGVNPTEARAKGLWKELKESAPSALARLKPRYVTTGNNEGETRIIAGPFVDASDAIRACVAVRAAKGFCKTSLFPQ